MGEGEGEMDGCRWGMMSVVRGERERGRGRGPLTQNKDTAARTHVTQACARGFG